MIKVHRPAPPQILIDNQDTWTTSLLTAVATYGSYSNIPEKEKKQLLSHYKHKDIQDVLFSSSHHKCAFCECKPGESGNIEVEHFEPKSIYPELTFDWNNLLPACRKCNESKLNFDTRVTPIINPATENPEDLLTYSLLRITPLVGSGEEAKAQTTIDVLNLNCERLYNARSTLLKTITEYTAELRRIFEWISEADTQQKRHYRITKLSNSLEIIEAMLNEDSAYSGFMRCLVNQFPEYQEAKRIIASR